MTQYVYGKNVVRQLLNEQKKIYEIVMMEGFKDAEIEKLLKQGRYTVKRMNRKNMDKFLNTGNHQGIAASIDEYKTYTIDEIINAIPEGKLPLLVMLDGLEDPHNLGAILRTSDCIGVDGVIIGKHRSVSLTPTVAKVSTGAIDTIKVATVTNLSQTLNDLKQRGYWIVGADLERSVDYRKGQYDVPICLVIGSEGFGISKLVKKQCDYCVSVPMVGTITSLNASVATAVLLYQIHNQRYPL